VKASRGGLYARLDRKALKALAERAYEYAECKQVGVNIDYHVSVEDHYYSVPYTLVRESKWARATHRRLELFHKSKRITAHPRSYEK